MYLHSVIEKALSLLDLFQPAKLQLVVGSKIILVIEAGGTRVQLFLFAFDSL